ncbi:RNA 2',3'-cyclic phosphodiesterase [Thalassotalea sp. M1531]|uniref:RNA 2',3'-cyclic phosphodiesterase n=1 Tax=Thalassotalea algicola TaxID=2716224 RepID=A0A7Y0LER9_9GAMM|nr:RNA 2',3'-cyclic phosphodiesterase [Thalassotalea algicola]NMP31840.1 RNA 2',3'-cyclic phosphodiesterase [Thalassotalea algicola]
MARYFFALDIAESDKKRIAVLQQNIKPPLPKPTVASNLHLTLVFLGQLSPEQLTPLLIKAEALSKNYLQSSEYQLHIDHYDMFDQAKVLFLGMANTPSWLAKLVTELELAADKNDIDIIKRPYQPHITISRKVRELPEHFSANLYLNIKSFSLYISESSEQGVIYTPLKKFKLAH